MGLDLMSVSKECSLRGRDLNIESATESICISDSC